MNRKSTCCAILVAVFLLVSASSFGSVVPAASQRTYPRDQTVYIHIDGGKLANPHQYNPFLEGWIGSAGHHQLCIEYLFYYNHANGTIMPWLATGISWSTDFMTYTMTLRQGVKWSDGVDFTARDVAFTFNMLLTPHEPPLAYESSVQEWIESVEVVDDYTVRFNLKKPNPRFYAQEMITVMDWGGMAIVPEHIWKDVDPTTWDNPSNVWTGPYQIVVVSETGDMVIYERLDNWWGTKVFGIRPAAKYWIWVWYATAEAAALQLSVEKLDWGPLLDIYTFLSIRDRNPNVRAFYIESPYAFLDPAPLWLEINCAKYPWNNREVRRALSYYIDRDALNEISQGGIAPPYPGIFGHWNEPRYLQLMREKGEEYDVLEYNPAKGDAILTSLGWSKGADGFWVTENGTRATFEMLVFGDFGTYLQFYGEQMVDQLRDAGIDCAEKLMTGAAKWDALDTGQFDGAAWWIGGMASNEPFYMLDWLTSKYIVPLGEPAPGNSGRWSNSTYDAVLAQMEPMTPTDPRYMTLISQALDILYQEMPFICTISDAEITPFSTKYWTNWPTAENFYVYCFVNAYCGAGHFAMLEIEPAAIPTTTVYWTKPTTQFRPQGTFRGIDHVWYGPFEQGDAAIIPVDDAEFWVRMGYASFTPPTTIPVEELVETVNDLSARVGNMETTINSLTSQVNSLSSQISTLTILAGVALIVSIIALVVGFLKRKP